jgi:methylmalonyl-CoA mutase cobalamin-binding subunit
MVLQKTLTVTQAAVEQNTGMSREVLRKWEQRYGFPRPLRGARGQRLYRPEDVLRLQQIRTLTRRGLRPGKLVVLSVKELDDLLLTVCAKVPALPPQVRPEAAVQGLLACLATGAEVQAAQSYLEGLLRWGGLAHFVEQLLPAFNLAVGLAWVEGRLQVHSEHHYSETVSTVVQSALANLPKPGRQPRVLLTTPPGELHRLGLLAVQAALSLQGADCVCLGTQTPAFNVVQAVTEFDAQVVAISASVCRPLPELQTYVADVRQQLPVACRLWLGGQGCAPLQLEQQANLALFENTGQAVQAWRAINCTIP